MNLNPKLVLALGLCALIWACKNPVQTVAESKAAPALYAHFTSLANFDTLVVTTVQPDDSTARQIGIAPWYGSIDSQLLAKVEFEPDTFDTEGFTFWKTSLDAGTELCLIGFQQSWYRNKSLLIYDKASKSFMDLIPASTFYGGDGGQILTGTWLYDIDGDGFTDLTMRESEHNLEPGEPDPVDIYSDGVRQWRWDTTTQAFVPLNGIDSSALIKRFPLPWWE